MRIVKKNHQRAARFLKRRRGRIEQGTQGDPTRHVLRFFPGLTIEALRRWLRIDISGEEHLRDLEGGALISPNHSGCAGFDAVLVADQILRTTGHVPRILTYWKHLEKVPLLEKFAKRLGCVEASHSNALEVLERDRLLLLFPEGEEGSFKPTTRAYELQRFRTGFVRLAVRTGKPIVPCLVIGAEETHINLARIRVGRGNRGITMPLPLSFLPLPAKWSIRFLPPIDLSSYKPEDADDMPRMEALATQLQQLYQQALDSALQERPYIYLPNLLKRRSVQRTRVTARCSRVPKLEKGGKIFPVIQLKPSTDRPNDGERGSTSTHSNAPQVRRNRRRRSSALDRIDGGLLVGSDSALAGGERPSNGASGSDSGRGAPSSSALEGRERSLRMDDPAVVAGSGTPGDSNHAGGLRGVGFAT